MAIDYELVQGGGQDIFQVLGTRLGLGGIDEQKIHEECVQEVKQVASKRGELNRKLDRLTEALAHAKVLQNSVSLT